VHSDYASELEDRADEYVFLMHRGLGSDQPAVSADYSDRVHSFMYVLA
jgi:hypothetical protein